MSLQRVSALCASLMVWIGSSLMVGPSAPAAQSSVPDPIRTTKEVGGWRSEVGENTRVAAPLPFPSTSSVSSSVSGWREAPRERPPIQVALVAGETGPAPAALTTNRDNNPRVRNGAPDTADHESGAPLAPSLLYVDADATGANTGMSWTDAFADLQDALTTAAASGGAITEIWVAEGTYTPSAQADPSDPRTASFHLVNGVAVCGGFAGGETALDQRDVAGNETILSGDLAGDDGPSFRNNDENCYHVVSANSVDATAVLNGFIVAGGNADGPALWPIRYDRGGGVYCDSDATVIHCTFIGNSAIGGGGMYCGHTSYVGCATVADCTFIGNAADEGGAMWVGDNDPVITNLHFLENHAEYVGGAIKFGNDNFTQMTDCLFVGNTAGEDGGAIHCVFTFNMQVVDCAFSLNKAEYTGGAIYNGWDTDQTFEHCTFHDNEAGRAAGVFSEYEAPAIRSCILWCNRDATGTGETAQIDGATSPDIAFSCVQGWTGAVGGPDVIGHNPQLVGWNDRETIYVEEANTGFADGTLAHPYPTIQEVIGAAVNYGYSLALAGGSPCIGTGEGGSNMGAGHGVGGTPSEGPVTIYAAMGTYDMDTCSLRYHVSLIGPDEDIVTLEGTVRGLRDNARLDSVTVARAPQWGIDVDFSEEPIIYSVDIVDNALGYAHGYSYAGGINCISGSGPTISECHIDNNGGQGITCGPGSYPTIDYCWIRNNGGRGIRSEGASSATITNCRITDNRDGGVFFGPGSTSRISACRVAENTAGAKGGGIQCWHARPTIERCEITHNEAPEGGGIYAGWRAAPEILNCLLAGNEAAVGGGLAFWQYSAGRVTNCTLADNIAANGSGLSLDSPLQDQPSTVTVNNCILWNAGDQIWNNDASAVAVSYSDVQGGWSGTGNRDADPLFFAIGDYHLQAGSPCINAGDNAAVPPALTVDLDGNPRIFNETVDMGAYEFPFEPRELWVDDDAPGDPGPGDPLVSDPAEDGTPQHPFDQIAEALAAAAAGDWIRVAGGIYLENVTMKPGVNILGAGAELTTIEGVSVSAVVTGASNCRIDGFTIIGPGEDDVDGVYCEDVVDFAVTRNIIRDHTWDGVFSLRSSVVVAGNLILNNRCAGVWVYGVSAEPSQIVGNTVWGNSNEADLAVWDDGSAFAANNILEDVDVRASSLTLVRNNVVNQAVGGDNMSMPPGFVDPLHDYHLRSDSPCIDAGSNAAIPAILTTDLDGQPRILGGTVDMGAYECAPPVPPTRLYVDADATGANNGTSWTDAYTDLQDALAVARVWFSLVEEIWVAEGTYRPDGGSGDRTAAFELMNGLTVYGGFAGGEPDPTQRQPWAHPTILSGDLDGDDLPGPVNNAENSYHVVVAEQVDPTAILDGFVIAGGNANGEGSDDPSIPWDNYHGGGLRVDAGMPTVMHCFFRGNHAMGGGGAVFASGSSPTLVSCLFTGNSAGYEGGAMANNSCGSTLLNCSFSGNRATKGGALASYDDSIVTVTNCIIGDNGVTELYDDGSFPDNSCNRIDHSCVRGGHVGPGNIDADPLWIDIDGGDGVFGTADDNARLQPGSPCVDTGTSGALVHQPTPAIEIDLDGHPRVVNGEVDMGPFELQTVPPPPVRLYVDQDATGANDGTSWAHAFNDLQNALQLAADWPGGVEEIWVAEGTYTPSALTNPVDPRTATFALISGVAVYGGFAAVETKLEQRDLAARETILSGDLAGDDGPNHANRSDNCYHVVTTIGSDARVRLDGFTITGGNADAEGQGTFGTGGGMYSQNAHLTIANCTFVDNDAYRGGGYCNQGGAPTLIYCAFLGNRAYMGAGMANSSADAHFIGCAFVGNTAASGGGGASSDGTFLNCRFNGNTADWGAGLYTGVSETGLIQCTFQGNRARDSGGGIHSGVECDITLANSILWGNTAPIGPQIALFNEHWTTRIHITHSDLEGSSAAIYAHVHDYGPILWGDGNIGLDPVFVAPGHWEDGGTTDPLDDAWTDGDYGLQSASPCIGAGDDAALPPDGFDLDGDGNTSEPLPLDLAGNPRIMHGAVDMGAYEYRGPLELYVDDDAAGDPGPGDPLVSDPLEDGTLAHPFDAIQDAIDAAKDGDTVIVLDGTYTGPGNRDIEFRGKAITVRSQNGPDDCVVDAQGTETESHRGFTLMHDESEDAILEGFTITGGNASGPSWLDMDSGGGILCNGSLTIRNNVITSNTAKSGGGLFAWGSPTIENNTIVENAAGFGGGINASEWAIIINNTVSRNTAIMGGGIWTWEDCPSTIINNVITDNWAGYDGGGIGVSWDYYTIIVGNLIARNVAGDQGGGIYLATDPLLIANNTIVANSASSGGGIYSLDWWSPVIVNNILWHNGDDLEGCSATYSCIEDGDPGEGNIVANPRFVNASGGDYRLQSGSPCVNAGDNAALPPDTHDLDGDGDTTESLPLDLVGNPRILGGTIDMGAYETSGTSQIEATIWILPRTLNRKSNGRWVTCWIELPEGYRARDINADGLRLNETVAPAPHPRAIGDHNENGVLDLMVKFPRDEVIATVEVGKDIVVTVTGMVAGTPFEGTDTIRVIEPGVGDRRAAPGQPLVFSVVCLAEGLAAPVTYTGENLPPGATLDPATGLFRWTPTPDQIGVYPDILFRATDGIEEVIDTIAIRVETMTGVRPGRWTRYR